MHPIVYEKFGQICRRRQAGGSVLEVGAVPSDDSLLCLPCLQGATEKIGLNLRGPHEFRDFTIVPCNANAMTCFPDGRFDTVLCNATLEHDPFFWKTLAEIRRVARPGALVVIGVPGYAEGGVGRDRKSWLRQIPGLQSAVEKAFPWLSYSTPTLPVHNYPGDYYRFSRQALRDVFFENYRDVQIETVMMPPRIIGSGLR